jgi:ribosomal protein S3
VIIITWTQIIKKSSFGDKVIKNRVRIFYTKLKLDKYIRNIDIDRENKTITISAYPQVAGLMIGRRGKNAKELGERLGGWTVTVGE